VYVWKDPREEVANVLVFFLATRLRTGRSKGQKRDSPLKSLKKTTNASPRKNESATAMYTAYERA